MKEKFALSSYAQWIVACLSLVINVGLIIALLVARSELFALRGEVATTLTDLLAVLENVKASSFDYTVAIDQELPVKGDIPVSFVVHVPIKTTIPINTSVSVPANIPFVGTVYVNVPISANVPVDLTVDVPIEQTIPIDITVPVQLDVPISIKIADMPLAQNLTDLQAVLNDLFASLTGSPLPTPTTGITPTP
jgi:hypothetical protein